MTTLQWEYNLVERSCCGQLNAIDWQRLEGATSVLELIALLTGYIRVPEGVVVAP